MKKVYSVIAAILIIVMSVSALSACKDNDTEATSSESPVSSSAASQEADKNRFDELPVIDFGATTFNIFTEGDHQERYKSVEIFAEELNKELINDAVYERNKMVEKKFNVKITETRSTSSENSINTIRNDMEGGTNLFQALDAYIPDLATLAAELKLYDLSDYDYFDGFQNDYWDKGSIEGLSIANKVYFAIGDCSMLSYDCTQAIVFNKDLINEMQLDSPYELVDNKLWTMDKLMEMGKDVTTNSDAGDPAMNYKDTWGFFVNQNYANSLFVGSGERFTGKDANDLPIITVNTERAVSVVQKIVDLYSNTSCTLLIESYRGSVDDVYTEATEAFASKRALFRSMAIVDMKELGDYNVNYGILPTPLYIEEQDSYHCLVSTLYATGFAIPVTIAEPEKSALVLEAITAASKDTVKKSYYEVMLKKRKIQDDESEKMLDLIFESRVYDLGVVYNWGGDNLWDVNSIGNFVHNIAISGQNTFTSRYAEVKDKIETQMQATTELLRAK